MRNWVFCRQYRSCLRSNELSAKYDYVSGIPLSRLVSILDAEPRRIGQRYGAINVIRYFGETPMVELVNAAPASIAQPGLL